MELSGPTARVGDVNQNSSHAEASAYSHQMGGGPGPADLDSHIYSRLLRERIVFLGSEVRDQNANAICAQLLLLSAEDPDATSSCTSTARAALWTPAWRSTTR